MRLHKDTNGEIISAAAGLCSHKKTTCNHTQLPHNYNPLESCIAVIVTTPGSPMAPTSSKEDVRSPEIRRETAAASGAQSAARAQPMSAFPGFILLSVLLQ